MRRAIFCDEQGLFKATDEDERDAAAFAIAAVHAMHPGAREGEEVVGTVRIYEAEPGLWYGGRLGVARAHRKQGVVGRGLVHKAVTTAHGWGCQRFLALVQVANVPFFESIHWRSLEERSYRDHPHHLMQADLASYPPGDEPRPPSGARFR
ncbi:MAG TPA: MSMEG_0567/Sll0786 family nitrogen starvation N-acetyltransferase [Sorangium sp.]|uniref:MSMEG_0567/Sll0786 family nitrogen starvation N-acetyltransferase n=1 Tax=Sorangium sp. So ce1153 TaxID=3133333 RepID=UPI002BF4667E|nr:MSMEG_0567/Sll0786 family nitrogen starvation N-acetyltransferase [Sorangium sp.]